MIKSMVSTLILGMGFQVLACNGFAPENNLRLPIGADKTNNMTEQQYHQVLDRIENIYAPIIKAHGGTFFIDRLWSDATVNAYASRTGDQWAIHMHGGIARHEFNSIDGLALVTCHELGHHLGGAPVSGGDSTATWITNEGQSDYFATTKCFRKYVEEDDNISIVSKMNIPKIVKEDCESQFSDPQEVAICKRGAMAGYDLGRVLATLEWPEGSVSFDSPSRRRVWWTSDLHPKAQCRLDTYFQGALCDKGHWEDFDRDDPTISACTRKAGDDLGVRPRCWYKP